MRISDWSSDVCSSDLEVEEGGKQGRRMAGFPETRAHWIGSRAFVTRRWPLGLLRPPPRRGGKQKGAAARLPEQVWCDAFVVILQTAVGLPEAELASSVPACGGRRARKSGV